MVDKLLYRQIHPNFIIDNKATPQAFKPTKSNPDVSVYDGDMIDARSAWALSKNPEKVTESGGADFRS